jgi:hypothetical protein
MVIGEVILKITNQMDKEYLQAILIIKSQKDIGRMES